jgi:hypothetical protein
MLGQETNQSTDLTHMDGPKQKALRVETGKIKKNELF